MGLPRLSQQCVPHHNTVIIGEASVMQKKIRVKPGTEAEEGPVLAAIPSPQSARFPRFPSPLLGLVCS